MRSVINGIEAGGQDIKRTLTTPNPNAPSLIGMVKDASHAGQGMLGLTREALNGTLDPTSDEAIRRATEGAMLISPVGAGTATARGGVTAIKALSPAAADAERLGVRFSAGQRTMDPAILSREDAMMGGALGDEAQKVAQDFRAGQRQDMLNAAGGIEAAAGRGQADLARNQDAGQIVTDAVQQAAADAKAGYKAKYDTAFAQDGSLDPAVFTGRPASTEAHPNPAMPLPGPAAVPDAYAAPMSRRITDALVSAPDPVIIDPVLTPAAHRALGTLDNIDNLKLGSIGQPGAADDVVGINLRGVDQARRQLAAHAKAAAANPADQRAVRSIIDQFDNQVQTAMENGMFSGSDEALGALKDARQAYASYRRTFTPQGAGDDVGRAMNTIINRDATPEQVANLLYSGTKVGQNANSVRLADRLKGVIGEESPEWSAIRQGAWQRVLGPMEQSPQRAATRILDFVNGDGQSLAKRLFSDTERQHMTTLANVIKATAAPAGTANTSQSGNRLAGLMRKSLTALGASIGGTAVPGIHPAVGAAIGAVAGRGAETLGGTRAAAEARQLFGGQVPVTIGQRLLQVRRPILTTGQRRVAPIARQYLPGQDQTAQ
ncbi:hypothetical protein MKK88_05780 [Methylobacterium sp. E-005]|uniref:hypothetical protein n=1 Tax=Methylobacterium sp. E-005 TaxID=2836549 RepID=UPI001FB995D8|nr:hypothetical protein [Methylobacterium sp. E-005]MCJ2085504.1 hypothetical protein [Methylobacterium sp. E-005]